MAHEVYDAVKMGMQHSPEKKLKHVVTRKTSNGGHIHEHHFQHPDHPMEEHATSGDDGMVDHMLQHMGTPNPGEAEADAGQSGIGPAAQSPLQAATGGAQV